MSALTQQTALVLCIAKIKYTLSKLFVCVCVWGGGGGGGGPGGEGV